MRRVNDQSQMPLTRHCHNCGETWTLNGNPGRGETCLKCRADLRVCLNCQSYDPRAAEQCRERRADLVQEKHVGNFCEYFEFAKREWGSKEFKNSREETARAHLKKLLGD
jgi:ribosomal protein L32